MEELAEIYQKRGLEESLSKEVAKLLMDCDALGTHARDELGITENFTGCPVQAAFFSAGFFAIGAAIPKIAKIY